MVKRNCYCIPIPCSTCPPRGEEPAVGVFTASGSVTSVEAGNIYTISGSGPSTGDWGQYSDIYAYLDGEVWARVYVYIFCNPTGNRLPDILPEEPAQYETEDQHYVALRFSWPTSGIWDAPSQAIYSYARLSINDCRNNKPQFSTTLSKWQGETGAIYGQPAIYWDVVGSVNVSFA